MAPLPPAVTLAVAAALTLPLLLAPSAARAGTGSGDPARPPGPCPATLSSPLPLRALDLALLGPDRLVVLGAEELALFSLGERHLTLLSRQPLAGPFEVVRVPGGILHASEREAAVWAMTSRTGRAMLYAMEKGELVERQQASALPFPGSRGGLRYGPGTNLLEGEVEPLGRGPFLDVAAAESVLAVSPEGRLLAAGRSETGPRVGPTLAPLWPGLFAASLPVPPGADDRIVVRTAAADTTLATCAAPGPVRAITARVQGETAQVAVAMDDGEGGSSLLVFELPRPAP